MSIITDSHEARRAYEFEALVREFEQNASDLMFDARFTGHAFYRVNDDGSFTRIAPADIYEPVEG